MTHVGIIYGYPRYVGQVQSGEPRRWENRWRTHAKNHPDWPRPVVLETVTGVDRADLLFNLNFQETVWIVKCQTYRPIWPDGCNQVWPVLLDYQNIGRIGGLVGSRTGAGVRAAKEAIKFNPEVRERHRVGSVKGGRTGGHALKALIDSNPEVRERHRVGSVKGGRIGGRATKAAIDSNPEVRERHRVGSVKGGHALKALIDSNPEFRERHHVGTVKGGRIGGRATKAAIDSNPEVRERHRVGTVKGGRIGGQIGAPISNHRRWHVARGLKNPRCSLCVAEEMS